MPLLAPSGWGTDWRGGGLPPSSPQARPCHGAGLPPLAALPRAQRRAGPLWLSRMIASGLHADHGLLANHASTVKLSGLVWLGGQGVL